MGLSSELVSQFAKITKTKKAKTETTCYGTIIQYKGIKYVKLDGSNTLLPASTTVDMLAGERVTVMIKNHSAVITGNITSPSARSGAVFDLETKVNEIDYQALTNLEIESLINSVK